TQEAGVLDGRRADDDVGNTDIQVAFDGVQVADATANLHGHVVGDGSDNGLDGGFVLGLARDGAVQVDQVQAPGALVKPLRGHGGRVFGKNGGIVQVALAQAHTMPVFQVNGGDE